MVHFCCFKRKVTSEEGDILLQAKKRSPFERLNDRKVRSGLALGFFVLCIVTALVVGVPGGLGVAGHFVPFLESITHVLTLPGSTAMAIIGGVGGLGAMGFSFWLIMKCVLIPKKDVIYDDFDTFFQQVSETNIIRIKNKSPEALKALNLPNQCLTIAKCETRYYVLVQASEGLPFMYHYTLPTNTLEGAKEFIIKQQKEQLYNCKPFLRK